MILMWSCPGNMPKYYPGLRDIKYFPINFNGKESCNISFYYIDRCELWGFIREMNSCIFTCENISFFSPNHFYITISVVVTSLVVLQ